MIKLREYELEKDINNYLFILKNVKRKQWVVSSGDEMCLFPSMKK